MSKNSLSDLFEVINNFRESKNQQAKKREELNDQLRSLPIFINENIQQLNELKPKIMELNYTDFEKYISNIDLKQLNQNNLYDFQYTFAKLIQSSYYKSESMMQNKSINFISPTGSGKTFSQIITICYDLIYNNINDYKITLILTPNKNLCEQIQNGIKITLKSMKKWKVYKKFINNLVDRHLIQDETNDLDHELTKIIISTPVNFLNHFLLQQNLDQSNRINKIVVDEADYIFNSQSTLNSLISIRNLVITNNLQFQFFSATIFLNPSILNMLKLDKIKFIVNEDKFHNEVKDDIINIPKNIQNYYVVGNKNEDLIRLIENLLNKCFKKILIFFNSKNETFTQYNQFQEYIESNKTSRSQLYIEPENIFLLNNKLGKLNIINEIRELKSASKFVCFTSDMLSRGMDIEDVDVVINFNLNNEISQFIHRMGRTGRNGRRGIVITMGQDSVNFISRQLQNLMLWNDEDE